MKQPDINVVSMSPSAIKCVDSPRWGVSPRAATLREGLLEEVGFACGMEDGREKEERERSHGFRAYGGLNLM